MNYYNFNNPIGVTHLINEIISNEQIKSWVNDFQNSNIEKIRQKNKFQILGMTLNNLGLISNDKIIYDLYRFTKNVKVKCEYFFEQCDPLLNLLELNKENKSLTINIKGVNHVVAEILQKKRNPRGRILGKKSQSTRSGDVIKKIHPEINKWNQIEQFIIKNLESTTFSLYSFEEYKAIDPNNALHQTRKIREVKRSLIEFKDKKFVIYYKDIFNRISLSESSFKILPVGIAKQVLQTDESWINDNILINFFFELGIERKFDDFAIGYYRETHISNGFKIGTVLLVQEKTVEGKKEIFDKKVITYQQLSSLPIEILGEFFKNREHNLIKPPTIHKKNFRSLREKILSLETKPKDLAIFQNDIFVSMPLLFDNPKEKQYTERLRLFIEFKTCINKNFKISFAPESLSLEEYKIEIKNNSFQRNLDKIAVSKYFILIIPKLSIINNSTSKAFLELGIATYLKRPTLIIYHIESEEFIPKDLDCQKIAFSDLRPFKSEDINKFFIYNNTDFF